MRLVRPSVSVVLVAAVLALAPAGAGAQDEGTPEPISENGAADAPPRSDEAAYTQWFVRQAIERYDAEGREAALEYFNDPASVDGQWYAFVVNADGILIGHATRPDLRGTSTAARLDVFGKPYGQEIVAATAEGRWVDYYFTHPETGQPEQKHSWVVHHDGLFIGSGWYDVDESEAPPKLVPRAYARYLVAEAIERYDTQGRDYTLDYHNSPDSLDGEWYVFIADSDGISRANPNRADIVGTDRSNATDITGKNYGQEIMATTAEGTWVDYYFTHPETREETQKHSWVVRHDGLIFGVGWHESGEVPPQTDVAGYTQYLVHRAIERYAAEGRDAVVEYYNDPATVDGQWYVVIHDADGAIIAHPLRPDLLGTDSADAVDINGKPFGAEVDAAGESGAWVDYYFIDPSDGEAKRKHTWAIRYDHLLFASGWYTVPQPEASDAPPRSDAAAYTQWFVRQAIEHYDSEGLDATFEHYNDPASVDGPWYVVIIRFDGEVVANATRPDLVGTNSSERRDIYGKPNGREVLSSPEEGRWVDYHFTHPATGQPEQKHTWAVHHDGYVFLSGWYELGESDAPPKIARRPYARYLVAEAIERYESEGREHALAYHNSPDSIDGEWYVFIARADGISQANANRPDAVGTDLSNVTDITGKNYGRELFAATAEGSWVDHYDTHPETREETRKHTWVVRHDDLIFGTGWHEPAAVPAPGEVAYYTWHLVHEAIERYETAGLDAAVSHHSDPANVDGQWYAFIIAGDGTILGHPNAEIVGKKVSDLRDINGKPYGEQLATAGETGAWLDYYFADPVDGRPRQKHSWVVLYDGLWFGSGWYEVDEAVADGVAEEARSTLPEGTAPEPPAGPAEDTATG